MSHSTISDAPKVCHFCVTGKRHASKIVPDFSTCYDTEDIFHDVLSQIIHRGYCLKHPRAHNATDYKYLNGANLKPPTERDRELYLELFKKGYSYNDLVEGKTYQYVKDSVITPICNVLAFGKELDFEKCGIPISKEMEARSIQAVYDEVVQKRTMPFRFSEKTASTLPRHPLDYFIYAKLRGMYARQMEPELICWHAGDCYYLEGMPIFCICNDCQEYIEYSGEWASPVQVLTRAERERMAYNRQAALLKRKRLGNDSTAPQKRLDTTQPAPCNVTITPAQRERMEANRKAALLKQKEQGNNIITQAQRERMEAKKGPHNHEITPAQRESTETNRSAALANQKAHEQATTPDECEPLNATERDMIWI